MMWKCFPMGRKLRNDITIAMCSSTPKVIALAAACGDIPYKNHCATLPDTGRYQGTSPALFASAAASMSTSVHRTPMIMQRMKTPSHESVIRSFFATRRK